MKPLPQKIDFGDSQFLTKIKGPPELISRMKFRWFTTLPQNKKKLEKNHQQTYFIAQRGDGLTDVWYYSIWQLSWWDRLKLFFRGKLYIYAVLPPPTEFPVTTFPMLNPLEIEVLEKNETPLSTNY